MQALDRKDAEADANSRRLLSKYQGYEPQRLSPAMVGEERQAPDNRGDTCGAARTVKQRQWLGPARRAWPCAWRAEAAKRNKGRMIEFVSCPTICWFCQHDCPSRTVCCDGRGCS